MLSVYLGVSRAVYIYLSNITKYFENCYYISPNSVSWFNLGTADWRLIIPLQI